MSEADSPSRQAAELDLLREAFERFMGAGESISRAYDELRAKIDELNLQLNEKNRELQSNLAEKERLSLHLSNVLGSLRAGVLVIDGRGRVETANGAAAQIFCRENLDGIGVSDLLPLSVSVLQTAVGNPHSIEIEHVIDDEARVLRVGVHPMVVPQLSALAPQAVSLPPGHVLLIDDITEEHRDRAKSQRTERLAAMGEMAVKIVHEVRNPMGSIELVASLLARDVAGDAEQSKLVDRIRSGIRTMNHTINNLLSFARDTQPRWGRVAPEHVLELCVADNAQLLEAQKIRVERVYRNGRWVRGDAELLRQVFMNLILNAAQAMPGGGVLTLSTEDDDARREGGAGAPSSFVRARVADTGEGMDRDIQARVFHPFFTTKERGTGLGLALAHNIVRAHNGTIDVTSEVGRGATFTVALPVEAAEEGTT